MLEYACVLLCTKSSMITLQCSLSHEGTLLLRHMSVSPSTGDTQNVPHMFDGVSAAVVTLLGEHQDDQQLGKQGVLAKHVRMSHRWSWLPTTTGRLTSRPAAILCRAVQNTRQRLCRTEPRRRGGGMAVEFAPNLTRIWAFGNCRRLYHWAAYHVVWHWVVVLYPALCVRDGSPFVFRLRIRPLESAPPSLPSLIPPACPVLLRPPLRHNRSRSFRGSALCRSQRPHLPNPRGPLFVAQGPTSL